MQAMRAFLERHRASYIKATQYAAFFKNPHQYAGQTVKTTENGGPTAMTARRNSMAASALSAWRRRVSCGVSSSTPPL
jgi:hypothetical protein